MPQQRTRKVRTPDGKTKEETYTVQVPVVQAVTQQYTVQVPYRQAISVAGSKVDFYQLDGSKLDEAKAAKQFATPQSALILHRVKGPAAAKVPAVPPSIRQKLSPKTLVAVTTEPGLKPVARVTPQRPPSVPIQPSPSGAPYSPPLPNSLPNTAQAQFRKTASGSTFIFNVTSFRQELRTAMRTVTKMVPRQETYSVRTADGKIETRTRTVQTAVQQQVPYQYTIQIPYRQSISVAGNAVRFYRLDGSKVDEAKVAKQLATLQPVLIQYKEGPVAAKISAIAPSVRQNLSPQTLVVVTAERALMPPAEFARRQLQKEIERMSGDSEAAFTWLQSQGGKIALDKRQPGRPVVGIDMYQVGGSKVSDQWLKVFAAFSKLKSLDIGFAKVTDAGLKELASLKDLEELTLCHTQVSDAGIKKLVSLTSLRNLDLNGTRVTDASMEVLSAFQDLRHLNLNGTQVTDIGLKQLEPLKNLRSISLFGANVTDVGLQHLASHKSLEWLTLDFTQVTDAGMKALTELPHLEALILSGTQVTDAGLEDVAKIKSLRRLDLQSTKISDAGLKSLASLDNLEVLVLQQTKITDSGLKELAPLKGLKKVYVKNTQVSAEGIASLRKALPKCDVTQASP